VTPNTQEKNQSAEERSQDTRRFVRQVRSASRRKYTVEEKIHIVLEGFRREVTINELCRREGIKPNNFCSWTKESMKADKQRLSAI
jgi:transposase